MGWRSTERSSRRLDRPLRSFFTSVISAGPKPKKERPNAEPAPGVYSPRVTVTCDGVGDQYLARTLTAAKSMPEREEDGRREKMTLCATSPTRLALTASDAQRTGRNATTLSEDANLLMRSMRKYEVEYHLEREYQHYHHRQPQDQGSPPCALHDRRAHPVDRRPQYLDYRASVEEGDAAQQQHLHPGRPVAEPDRGPEGQPHYHRRHDRVCVRYRERRGGHVLGLRDGQPVHRVARGELRGRLSSKSTPATSTTLGMRAGTKTKLSINAVDDRRSHRLREARDRSA